MPEAEWGVKRCCGKCDAKFYDMQKPNPACPRCGSVVELEIMNRSHVPELDPEEEKDQASVPDDEVENDTLDADNDDEIDEDDDVSAEA